MEYHSKNYFFAIFCLFREVICKNGSGDGDLTAKSFFSRIFEKNFRTKKNFEFETHIGIPFQTLESKVFYVSFRSLYGNGASIFFLNCVSLRSPYWNDFPFVSQLECHSNMNSCGVFTQYFKIFIKQAYKKFL